MLIGIDPSVFDRFPGYRRGLVVAHGASNATDDPVLLERLRRAERTVAEAIPNGDWRAHPRLAAWIEAFSAVGIPAGSRPPSVIAMVKRVLKGGHLPLVNQVVALMNITSLERLVPCGGDDLRAAGGDLLLRPATGAESYRPLGRPDVLEHPDPGEIVYVAAARGSAPGGQTTVLCRSWCWRNSEVTKLTGESTAFCLNLDFMTPVVPLDEVESATAALADDVGRHCGGEVTWRLLGPDRPGVDLADWV